MITYQVALLNPKAGKLLHDLADLNLISIEKTSNEGFSKVVNRLRAKASAAPPTLEEITREVEVVRTKRYARRKA